MHAASITTYALHPLGYCVGTAHQIAACRGYNLWSGIASDIGELSLVAVALAAIATVYRAHRCTHCKRIGLHPLAVHTPATTIANGAVTTRQATTHTYRSCRKHLDHDHAGRARAQRSKHRLLARLRRRAVNRRH